jgi:hypothetical protein
MEQQLMTSSFPQPANKTYDYVSEIINHFENCETECKHHATLKELYGLATFAIALDCYISQTMKEEAFSRMTKAN